MNGTPRAERAIDESRAIYPVVYFSDFAPEPCSETCNTQEWWPEAVLTAFARTLEAAAQGALLLHREMLDIAQRNTNARFGLLRKLAGARNLGAMLDVQAAYWHNQLRAFTGQTEELSVLSRNATTDIVKAYVVRIAWSREVGSRLTGPTRRAAA